MRARAPASSANLGPGFDVLAVALSAYVEVSVEPAPRLEVRATGYGADLPADATHLAARVAAHVTGHDRLAVEVVSDIPVGRGLGSSAALAVAAAAAAGAAEPFLYGVEIDGHPENAAASAFGDHQAAEAEAAAFSGCPSMATPYGRGRPHRPRRRRPRPGPRRIPGPDRDVRVHLDASRSWPVTGGDPGGQVGGVGREVGAVAGGVHLEPGGRLDRHLDVGGGRNGQGVEARAQVGRRSRGAGSHRR